MDVTIHIAMLQAGIITEVVTVALSFLEQGIGWIEVWQQVIIQVELGYWGITFDDSLGIGYIPDIIEIGIGRPVQFVTLKILTFSNWINTALGHPVPV